MTDFKDQFSKQSNAYKKYRPSYPDALFEYLSTLTEEHELAWDSGTGNGQAAFSLVDFYTDVYATDPSEEQIENATPHPNITYRVERAEDCSLDDASVDLVTVAQALHWFDFYAFYAEVKRVLKEGGVFAAWTYGRPSINRNIDGLIRYFHDELLEGYWRYENRLVDLEYVTLPFPFKELSTPQFEI
ncbi:MAG: class I SAM-dependent methyltransferase, partial [Balneolaceae bacterium]|nr:class I SAM-dependent methyltransferase [Balneolaceae bacterium]